MRLYLPWEIPEQDHSREQCDSARGLGCTVSGYAWPYHGIDPTATAYEALKLATDCHIPISSILWYDVETVLDSHGVVTIPTAAEVRATADRTLAEGGNPGMYTSLTMWARAGSPDCSECWNWTANYTGHPALDSLPLYGGWARDMVVGHQFTSTPYDQSVFWATALE